jgi:hypothetical protein
VDYDCLQKYNEMNKHFSVEIIQENQEGEQERAVEYYCFYRYGTHRVKLEFNIENGFLKRIPIEIYEEEEHIFESILDDIQSLL